MPEIIKTSPIYVQRNGEWWFPRCPSSYAGGIYTLVSDARNSDGYFVGDVIRNETAKCSITFNVILANELSELLKCFSSRYGGKFVNTMRFLDIVSDEYIERSMYVGDREAELYSQAVLHNGQKMYINFPINFVEV